VQNAKEKYAQKTQKIDLVMSPSRRIHEVQAAHIEMLLTSANPFNHFVVSPIPWKDDATVLYAA
jgi:hypothetical protein